MLSSLQKSQTSTETRRCKWHSKSWTTQSIRTTWYSFYWFSMRIFAWSKWMHFHRQLFSDSLQCVKTINEIRKSIVTRQLNDALNIWNDSFSMSIHNLSLNFFVLVYCERNDDQSESWKDSFKFLSVNDESMIIELSSDSTKFRSTMIKSYYDDDHLENSSSFISITVWPKIIIIRR
jgi:hypothetical protein